MKYYVIAFCLFFITGCSTVSSLVSYTQSNPLIVDLATRQAVIRFIDGGDTPEDKTKRATEVIARIERVEYFVEGNPTASADTLLTVIRSNVDWESMRLADRLLVADIFTIIESNLKKSERDGYLDEDAVIRIRVLLRTLTETAEVFL